MMKNISSKLGLLYIQQMEYTRLPAWEYDNKERKHIHTKQS